MKQKIISRVPATINNKGEGGIKMNILYGTIAGDIAGSMYEFNKKYKYLPDEDKNIFQHISNKKSKFTDDTVMTVAIMEALNNCNHNDSEEKYKSEFIKSMQKIGLQYINCGFGKMFFKWVTTLSDAPKPYGSFGNGAAMRVSPIGWYSNSLEEAECLATWSSEISHNTNNAITGAQTVAGIIYLAKNNASIKEIKKYASEKGYNLDKSINDITDYKQNNIACNVAVEQAIICLLNSENIYDAIEKAISIGGDADTIGAITGSMADALYGGIPSINLMNLITEKIPLEFIQIIGEFKNKIGEE